MSKVVVVIPARMGSSRFPGKPLAPILGLPMVEHVYRRCVLCSEVDHVVVATCDEEIRAWGDRVGAPIVMTGSHHARCTDRVAEAMEFLDADIVVIVQGDEPMVTPNMISAAVRGLQSDPTVFTVNLTAEISDEDCDDPNEIKVVRDVGGNALYFSRSAIPSRTKSSQTVTFWKQVCIMPFYPEKLRQFNAMAPTPLEAIESIDMLRLLEHGETVKLVEIEEESFSVDTEADLLRVAQLLKKDPLLARYAEVL